MMGQCERDSWLPAHRSCGLLENYWSPARDVASEEDAGPGWNFPAATLGLTTDRQLCAHQQIILSFIWLYPRKDGVSRALQLR